MQFQSYDLGHQERGAVVVVTLHGNAANVRLMDSSNYRAFKRGGRHRCIGGLAQTSPVRLEIPRSGRWYLTVDMIGLAGSVRSSVEVEPPPLPVLRSAPTSAPLSQIRHEIAPHLDDDQEIWDVFISHASEDKAAVARPLAEHAALRSRETAADVRSKVDAYAGTGGAMHC